MWDICKHYSSINFVTFYRGREAGLKASPKGPSLLPAHGLRANLHLFIYDGKTWGLHMDRNVCIGVG